MKKILLILILIPIFSWGKPSKIDDYYYTSKAISSSLKISQKNNKPYAELSISNKSGCKGNVSGYLIKRSKKIFMFNKNDSDCTCQLEFTKIRRSYIVVENNCSDFHGSQCDFNMTVKK